MNSESKRKRIPRLETLESRLLMTASVGWDGPGQGAATLEYHIGSVPSSINLDQTEVEDAIETALDAWAEVADITFIKTTSFNRRDSIDVHFFPIDGTGGTLAKAYLPDDVNRGRIAGNIQFDSSERWEIGDASNAATDLVLVAVHEIGHALGLEHSTTPGSVMAASVSPRASFSGLAPDDVDAILALYAPAEIVEPVRLMVPGDTDLDGDVDVRDLLNILHANKFGQGPSDATWAEGDFDADGDVDIDDILAIQTALEGQFPRQFSQRSLTDLASADEVEDSETIAVPNSDLESDPGVLRRNPFSHRSHSFSQTRIFASWRHGRFHRPFSSVATLEAARHPTDSFFVDIELGHPWSSSRQSTRAFGRWQGI